MIRAPGAREGSSAWLSVIGPTVLVFSVLSYDCWSQVLRIRMPALLTCSIADALQKELCQQRWG